MSSSCVKPCLSVGLLGANGYSGGALLALLAQHAQVASLSVFSRQPQGSLQEAGYLGSTESIRLYALDALLDQAADLEAVFLATPAEVSIEWAPKLLAAGVHVIDLSGGFRLSSEAYAQWYGQTHGAPTVLPQAVYGLQPYTGAISPLQAQSPQLIANPGCYATCVLMSLLPLLQTRLIEPQDIIVDAKSAVSGAGRQANAALLFAELSEDYWPYKIGQHQHTPEIVRYARKLADQAIQMVLTTQLLPIRRGLAATLYARCRPDITLEQVQQAYDQAYATYPWVRHAPAVGHPLSQTLNRLSSVAHTPYTHITYHLHAQRLSVHACLDNLLKGAASQAIENLNALYGYPLTTGLNP